MFNIAEEMKRREKRLNDILVKEGEKFQIRYMNRFTNNSVCEGYRFEDKEKNMLPCIYFNPKWWIMSDKEVVEMFKGIYYEYGIKVDMDHILTKDYVLQNICANFIPSESISLAKQDGYIVDSWLDLGITYYFEIIGELEDIQRKEKVSGLIPITKNMIDLLQLDPTELKKCAIQNMKGTEVITDLSVISLGKKKKGLTLITNSSSNNGATIILMPELVQELEKMFGNSFFILPSSKDELLITNIENSYEDLKEMLIFVNTFVIEDEKFLSNNIYYYKDKKFHICGNDEHQ